MTIRDGQKFLDGCWQWTRANRVLPHRCQFSDVDGRTEVNGHFCVLEGKPLGVRIERWGQWGGLWEDVRRGDLVIVLWGEKSGPQHEVKFYRMLTPNGPTTPIPGTWDDVCAIIKAWGEWADTAPPINVRHSVVPFYEHYARTAA